MNIKPILLTLLLFASTLAGCTQNPAMVNQQKDSSYKVTFIELGSVRCIPCKKMQPIMKSIEEKYGDQVKVVFHDVWTPEGQPFGDKFGINAIPTDENGKEFFRHEGYFPEEELVKALTKKGVKQIMPKQGLFAIVSNPK